MEEFIPDFILQADNVYRTRNYIVKQRLEYIENTTEDIRVFTFDSIEQIHKKDKALFEEMRPYYERLKTYMMIIIEKKEVYLMNELLTQSDFNDLQGFLFLIDDMITYCVNKNTELLIEHKKMFFEDITKLGNIVLVDMNHTFKITQYEFEVHN